MPLIVLALGLVGAVVLFFVKDWEWAVTTAVIAATIAGAIDAFTDPPQARKGGSSDAINFGG